METVLRDWENFVTYYWVHLRTSNPIESIFSGVRLRTHAARRVRCRNNAIYLVFKMVERLSGPKRMHPPTPKRGPTGASSSLSGHWLEGISTAFDINSTARSKVK